MRIGSGQLLGRRASQQDYFATLERDGVTVLVLADGIGGLDGGEVASAVAVKAFKASLERTGLADVRAALDKALALANRAIAVTGERVSTVRGMGTTLVALAIGERTVHWVSVGDSLVLRLRSGTVARMNRTHTRLVQLHEKVRSGELTLAEAQADPQRDSITSALQGEPIAEIDRGEEARWAEDGYALASDGVMSIGFPPLSRALAAGSPPQQRVETLFEAIERAAVPAQDNCTLLLAVPDEKASGVPTSRARRGPWLVAAAVALVLSVPVLWWSLHQRAVPDRTAEAAEGHSASVVSAVDGAGDDEDSNAVGDALESEAGPPALSTAPGQLRKTP